MSVSPLRRGSPPSGADDLDTVAGECVDMVERLVVTPTAGVFSTVDDYDGIVGVGVGDVLGYAEALGKREPIWSAFEGDLAGWLAFPGERIRAHQPIAWLRPVPSTHAALVPNGDRFAQAS